MRSLKVLGVVGLAISMAGCVPDWARENETGLLMEVAGVDVGPGGTLFSDVSSASDDIGTVTVNVYRKNINVTSTGPLEHVRLESYQVRYFRTDGHSVEGVDVPNRVTGAFLSQRFHTPTGPGELEIDAPISFVRQQAKLEPPLVNLRGQGTPRVRGPFLVGAGVFTAIGEITVYARQVTTGEPLSASGRFQVTFADFEDAAR